MLFSQPSFWMNIIHLAWIAFKPPDLLIMRSAMMMIKLFVTTCKTVADAQTVVLRHVLWEIMYQRRRWSNFRQVVNKKLVDVQALHKKTTKRTFFGRWPHHNGMLTNSFLFDAVEKNKQSFITEGRHAFWRNYNYSHVVLYYIPNIFKLCLLRNTKQKSVIV